MIVVAMLQVADVAASSSWYQQALGLTSGHGGSEFEMLFEGEPYSTPLVVQLHRWEADEHGYLGRDDLPVGNGCSLWFEQADETTFRAAWDRATEVGAHVLSQPAWNPLAHHHEFALRDPDGYVLVMHTAFDPTSAG